jgi:GAF domain-containing protein/HAMP domain-containing protein
LLLLLLVLTSVSVLIVGYMAVNSIQRFGETARQTSAGALRDQAEDSLRQLAVEEARRVDLILDAVRQDTHRVAQYAARVFSDPDAFADRAYWQAEDRMFFASDGQYKNAETDVSSAFVPDFAEVDENLMNALELGAYLDFVFVPTYEGNPNAVAVYMSTEHETTQYHPNIDLGAVVPPNFQVTERPWYVAAAPQENPERSTVWTSVYPDATGRGLLVTASAPVYARDQFIGGVGIDVTLDNIAASVAEARVLGEGYAFLVDGEGRAISLPEQGYEDVLGRAPEADEVWPDLMGTSTAFGPVLEDMMASSTGFNVLDAGGRELFVAYAPLESTNWSLATVAEEEAVLQAMAPLQTALQTSTRSLLLTRILPAGGGILFAVAAIGLVLGRRLTNPIRELAAAAQRVGAGEWDTPLPEAGDDEIGVLAHAFAQMTRQLHDIYASLEQRVAQRTTDLERRAVQVEAAAEVARDAATIRDMEQLLDETVHLISDRFGFYHAGIFLLDEAGQYAVLEAASSQDGQRMLERGHKLEVGRVGIVGYVAETGEARIALDVGADAVFFENPDLPNTRSEMALPLEVRGEIVGVLDVQSTEGGAFTDEDVGVLQTMADQVAVAIENARLLEESQRALRELERLYGQRTWEAWREEATQRLTYRYTGVGVEAVSPREAPRPERIGGRGEPDAEPGQEENGRRLLAPIRLRGQDIGSIVLRQDPEGEPWSPEEVALMEEVSTQVALALENARLLEESQRRAQRERMLSEMTARFTRSLDFDAVLQAAARELGRLSGVVEASVHVGVPQERASANANDTETEEGKDV